MNGMQPALEGRQRADQAVEVPVWLGLAALHVAVLQHAYAGVLVPSTGAQVTGGIIPNRE